MARPKCIFTSKVYKARPTRGPQNKDFTLQDLKDWATDLPGTKLRYEHGDDKTLKKKRIGVITRAWVDDEEQLVVEGRLRGPEQIGDELFTKLRDDLIAKRTAMVSMRWTGKTVAPELDEGKKIAVPESRWMKEISLVEKGAYPEAEIISVAAGADDGIAWEVFSSLLTLDQSTTSPDLDNKPTTLSKSVMSENVPVVDTKAVEQQHARLLAFFKETEQKKRYAGSIAERDQAYSKLFPELMDRNAELEKEVTEFRQEKKRAREQWETQAQSDASKLLEELKPHFEEKEHESIGNFIKSHATFEKKDQFPLVVGTYKDLMRTKAELGEIKKLLPTPEDKEAQRASEISVAASALRQEPKRQQTNSGASLDPSQAFINSMLKKLGNNL